MLSSYRQSLPASFESKQRTIGTNRFRPDAALDVATLDYFAHINPRHEQLARLFLFPMLVCCVLIPGKFLRGSLSQNSVPAMRQMSGEGGDL